MKSDAELYRQQQAEELIKNFVPTEAEQDRREASARLHQQRGEAMREFARQDQEERDAFDRRVKERLTTPTPTLWRERAKQASEQIGNEANEPFEVTAEAKAAALRWRNENCPAINRIVVDISCLADATFPILKLFTKVPQEVTNRWAPGTPIWDALGIEKKKYITELSRRGNGDFWAGIPASPWYRDLLAACKALRPTIVVSDVSSHPGAAGGRTRWLQSHFDLHFRDYLLGPRKHFLACPGTLLIDTSDEGAQIFRDAGGEAITFPCHWNSLHAHAADPMEYISRQLQERVPDRVVAAPVIQPEQAKAAEPKPAPAIKTQVVETVAQKASARLKARAKKTAVAV